MKTNKLYSLLKLRFFMKTQYISVICIFKHKIET